MKPLTVEWVEKAEADFRLACREAAAEGPANHDAVCFHAQQAAEKYLKACLQERDIPFPRVHDLMTLINLLSPPVDAFGGLEAELTRLSELAVATRYPGYTADRDAATDSLAIVDIVRTVCRRLLGLEADG